MFFLVLASRGARCRTRSETRLENDSPSNPLRGIQRCEDSLDLSYEWKPKLHARLELKATLKAIKSQIKLPGGRRFLGSVAHRSELLSPVRLHRPRPYAIEQVEVFLVEKVGYQRALPGTYEHVDARRHVYDWVQGIHRVRIVEPDLLKIHGDSP